MRRLNLGAGRDHREGWIDLDLVCLPGLDVVANLENTLPFRDDSFEEIESLHVLEHVDDFLGLVAELHRVTKTGGELRIAVPHFTSVGAHTDPTHKRFFGYFSFDYFTDEGAYNFYSNVRFRLKHREIRYFWIKNESRQVQSRLLTFLINLSPLVYERFFCWILPASEVVFHLEPIKDSSAS